MKKTYLIALLCAVSAVAGCSDENYFLLHCNTKGFNELRDLTFQECKCVVRGLEDSLSVEEFGDLNFKLRNNQEIPVNSRADIVLRDLGRHCVNELKQ